MDKRITNNQVTVSGEIISEFSFSNEVFGEKFYIADLSVERTSGKCDILSIMVSDRLVDVDGEWTGQIVKVSGQIRTYNKQENNRNRLLVSVFVREFEVEVIENGELGIRHDENRIFIDGFICKQPIYRETPIGREITDIMLAVNRPYGKSDYIPCIVWGRNARFASGLETGTRIRICGRFQSREYQKKINEGEIETRKAFEVSAYWIEAIEDKETEG